MRFATNPEQRHNALDAALDAFRSTLADADVLVVDYLALLALLAQALDKLDERLEAAHPDGPVHQTGGPPMPFTRRRSPTVVDVAKLERLGTARGVQYVAHGGAEFFLSGELATPDEAPDGALLVRVPQEAVDRDTGKRMEVGHTFEVWRPAGPEGTFAGLRRQPRAARLRLADALAGIDLLRARPAFFAPAPPSLFPALTGSRTRGHAEGRGPIRGRGILKALEGKGVQLELLRGALLAHCAGPLPPGAAEIVERAERLLTGYLSGQRAACELEHSGKDPAAEAWTVLVGGLLACEGHAAGELER